MKTPESDLPKLMEYVEKIAQAPGEHYPFQLSNSVILCFEMSKRNGKIMYTPFHCSLEGTYKLNERKSFTESFLYEPYKKNKLLLFNNTQLEEHYQLDTWEHDDDILAFPLSCLTGPKGILLCPLPKDEFGQKELIKSFPLVGSKMLSWLKEDLRHHFAPEKIVFYKSEDELVSSFANVVASWLSPINYRIFKSHDEKILETNFVSEFGKIEDSISIKLNTQKSNYVIWFDMPSFLYPSIYKTELIHERKFYLHRKVKYLEDFEGDLRYYHKVWRMANNPRDFFTQILLEEERNSQKKNNRGEGSLIKSDISEFVFYYEGNNQWRIVFQGRRVIPKISSQQGMEVIQILLSSPAEYFNPLDLHQLVKNKYTSKTPSFEPEIETIRQQEEDARNLLLLMKKEEHSIAKQLPIQRKKYWDTRFSIVKALLTFKRSLEYIREWQKAKKKVDELSIIQDGNFSLQKNIYKEYKNTDPTKNRKDSIVKGINKVLNSIEPIDTTFYEYLEETIVTKNVRNYKPFSYEPTMNTNPNLNNIQWFINL